MTPVGKLAERRIERVVTAPPPQPGFIGEGHEAVAIVEPGDFARSDPFIVLMDDRLDLAPGRRAGEAHPHAGFDVVTFVVEGGFRDRDEGLLDAGDVMWMTAGSGVIHNEDSEPIGRTRILQLWLKLPSAYRWSPPRLQLVRGHSVPVRREEGVEVRVYSGRSGNIQSTTLNYTPTTLVDMRLGPGATLDQQLAASWNGFVYVLEGDLLAGTARVEAGQVAWIAAAEGPGETALRLAGGTSGARAVLYAAERQNVPIVSHGPFIGESRADLMRISRSYVEGRMPRVSELQTSHARA